MEVTFAFAAERIALMLQIAAACGLAGIAWHRQIVLYPLLRRLDRRRFASVWNPLSLLEIFVVAPLLGTDLLAALVYAISAPADVSPAIVFPGLALTVGNGVIAAFPLRRHLRVLGGGFAARALRRMLCWHWIFAVLCSARAILVLMLVLDAIAP